MIKLKLQKTYNVTPKKDVKKKWYLIDAKGKPLGKVAAKAASLIRGKHKPIYTPYLDTGDNVIVINAKDVILTGKKFDNKMYYRHSHYPSGLKSANYAKVIVEKPILPMEKAIKGMLPKGNLGRTLYKNLRVYKDDKHNHASQNPEVIDI